MNKQICDAITMKRVLRIFYEGGFREIEPFCYGLGTSGNELLRAYQIGGHSNSGNPFGWKLFVVDKITSLTITNQEHTGARHDYEPRDHAMATVYCSI